MDGSARIGGFRRDGDGSPDIAFYRRRADRLRRAARAKLWRSVRRRTARAVTRPLRAALGAQAGPARLMAVPREAGFSRVRVAAGTPFNRVVETGL